MAQQVISAPPGYENILPDITIRTWSDKHGTTSESQKNIQQAQIAQYQNAYDYMMWEKQNEYNSPSSQMQRFKEAGLNPNLAYSMGNPGNASSAPESHDVDITPEMNHQERTLNAIEAASQVIKALDDIVQTASNSYATLSGTNNANKMAPISRELALQEYMGNAQDQNITAYNQYWNEFLRGTLGSGFGSNWTSPFNLDDSGNGFTEKDLAELFGGSESFANYQNDVSKGFWDSLRAEFEAKKSKVYFEKALPKYIDRLEKVNTYQDLLNETFKLYKEMGLAGQFLNILTHLF